MSSHHIFSSSPPSLRTSSYLVLIPRLITLFFHRFDITSSRPLFTSSRHHLFFISCCRHIPSSTRLFVLSSPPPLITLSFHHLVPSSPRPGMTSFSHPLVVTSPRPLVASSSHHLLLSTLCHFITSSPLASSRQDLFLTLPRRFVLSSLRPLITTSSDHLIL